MGEEALDDVVQHVERALSRRAEREVSTQEVGDLALAELERLDPVAWIRFASVYRAFERPEDFLALMQPLLVARGGGAASRSGVASGRPAGTG